MTVLSATVLLVLVIAPFGNIPLFLSALHKVEPARHKRIIVELVIALITLLLFLFAGRYLLDLIRISEPSLTVAGRDHPLPDRIADDLSLLAGSLRGGAGRGAIRGAPGDPIRCRTVRHGIGPADEPERRLEWLAALVLAWFVSGAILFVGSGLRRVVGDGSPSPSNA